MAKNNEAYRKTIRIALIIAGIIFTAGVIYATINNHGVRIEKVEVKANANENAVIRIETKLDSVKETVDKNAEVQQEILKEIRK